MSKQEREALIEQMKEIGEKVWLAIDYIEHGDEQSAYTLWDIATRLAPRARLKLGLLTKEDIM